MATTYTANAKLGKPGLTDTGWGVTLNATLDGLDKHLGISVTDYGADPSYSAAVNTAAFDAAIAAANGMPIYVPQGEWSLNALAKITGDLHLYGAGFNSVLKFNTTSIGMRLSYTLADDLTQIDAQTQEHQWYIHDLQITNEANTPAAYIEIKTIGVRIHRVLFTGTVTYAVDNYWGYGLSLKECTFIYLTGNGIRLRGYWSTYYERWSFVNKIDTCDFTYVTGKCIEAETLIALHVDSTVMQLSGWGFYGPTDTDSATWNLTFTNCWFEQNNEKDVDLAPGSQPWDVYYGEAMFIGCFWSPKTPPGYGIVDLNGHGVVTFLHCSGTSLVKVFSNSTSNQDATKVVVLQSPGIVQGESFAGLWNRLDSYASGLDTPIWTATGTTPSWGDAGGGGSWIQNNNCVTMEIEMSAGTTTTFGTGTWIFSSAFLVGNPMARLGGLTPIGVAQMFDQNTSTLYVGTVQFASPTTLVIWPHGGTAQIGPTSPFTWASGDTLRFQITFHVNE